MHGTTQESLTIRSRFSGPMQLWNSYPDVSRPVTPRFMWSRPGPVTLIQAHDSYHHLNYHYLQEQPSKSCSNISVDFASLMLSFQMSKGLWPWVLIRAHAVTEPCFWTRRWWQSQWSFFVFNLYYRQTFHPQNMESVDSSNHNTCFNCLMGHSRCLQEM